MLNFYTTCVDINASKLMGKVLGYRSRSGSGLADAPVAADECLSTSTIQ
jgi:hypothetical protein